MKPILTIYLSLAMVLPILGQDIAAFSGTKTPEVATVPNISAEPLTRGPGLTVAGGPTFNSGNWTSDKSLDTRDYIQWLVRANPGYIINITELQINFDRDPDGISHFFTGNGPAKIRIRTSLDNFKSDIYAHDKVSNSGQSPTIETSLKSAPGDTIVFRLYGFAANIGMLGPLGTLDIEGGLGTVLGLDNTGIRLGGKIIYDGLQYADGIWIPHAPNQKTGGENVIIFSGTYNEKNHVEVKNLIVNPEAGISVQKTGAITVNGNLSTANNIALQSAENQYSSLIVTGNVTGTVKYQREMKTKTLLGGSGNELLVSAPVTGEHFNEFRARNPNIATNTTNTPFLYGPFDKAKAAFTNYSKKDNAVFKPAIGYRAASTNNGSFTYKGTVNTGAVNMEISNSGPALTEWNLIGNPYPSYIKVSDFLTENSKQLASASSGIYTYDGDVSQGWNIYNLAYLTLHPHAVLSPGQGFMVAAKKGGGTVSFNPKMRTAGKPNEFNVGKSAIGDKVGYLRLKLESGIHNYHTEFYFNEHSTKGLDPGYDAAIYGDKAPDFSIVSQLLDNNKPLNMAVQSFAYADLSKNMSIPLALNASKGQHVTLSIADAMLPKETEVYLEDRSTETFTHLNLADYHVIADSKEADSGRFFLHLVKATLTYGEIDLFDLQIFTTNGSQTLHIEGNIRPDTIISVYDTQGRLLISRKLDEKNPKHKVDLSVVSGGMYLVKLRAGSMEKIKKIVIK